MNVLLIDDQERILTATKKLVDWKKLDVEEVYTANNAEAARKVLNRKTVDIVLVDIEMPGENGIRLQSWIHQTFPEIACIFLTSHADFQYAQEALRNGAYDYILQPASFSEIERVVAKSIGILKERRQIRHKSTQFDENQDEILKKHVQVMFQQREQFDGFERWKKDSQTEEEDWWYLPCLIRTDTSIRTDAEEKFRMEMERSGICGDGTFYAAGRLKDTELGILFYGKYEMTDLARMRERIWVVCQELEEKHRFELILYMGTYAKRDLPQKIGRLMEYKENLVPRWNEIYVVKNEIPRGIRRPDSGSWSRWLIRGDTVLLKNQIENLLHYAQEEGYLTIDYMRMLIHVFLDACSIACYEQRHTLSELFDASFTHEQMLEAFSSIEALEKGVDRVLHSYGALFHREEDLTFSNQERLQEILRYLEENMDRMISRKEAAQYVFLNEDYFSRMFRKETGMGYKEYVMKQKVEYAEKLLTGTDMPVVMVASKVGYENYTNFTQMFRKVNGMTPTDYRKNNR